jgi:hypothetical protein
VDPPIYMEQVRLVGSASMDPPIYMERVWIGGLRYCTCVHRVSVLKGHGLLGQDNVVRSNVAFIGIALPATGRSNGVFRMIILGHLSGTTYSERVCIEMLSGESGH